MSDTTHTTDYVTREERAEWRAEAAWFKEMHPGGFESSKSGIINRLLDALEAAERWRPQPALEEPVDTSWVQVAGVRRGGGSDV